MVDSGRRLLIFNLAVDSSDPVLGFASRWIEMLAAQAASVDVITMRQGHFEAPHNVRVHSVGKERGYSEARRLARFYWLLVKILRTRRPNACFSHMMPLFSVLAGPILRLARVPMVTWYAHPQLTRTVRLAHFFSNTMASSLMASYPYRRNKLVAIGQGIDTEHFCPTVDMPDAPPMILCAGRISPAKRHDTLISALSILRERNIDFRCVILGVAPPNAASYVCELRAAIANLNLAHRVAIVGGVPPSVLPEWYRRCAVHVNLTPSGFGDKVAWEAMACGRPSLVANDGYLPTLGRYATQLLFEHANHVDLANRIAAILRLGAVEQREMGQFLRQRVVEHHSLATLADRILALFDRNRSGVLAVRDPRQV